MNDIKDLQLIPKESLMIIFFNSAEVYKSKQLEIENVIEKRFVNSGPSLMRRLLQFFDRHIRCSFLCPLQR